MAAWRAYFEDTGYEKLEEARKLAEEYAKDDPESEPYRSKYKARDILLDIRSKVQNFRHENSSEEHLVFLDAVLTYKIGVNYIETEQLGAGEDELKASLDLTEEHMLAPKAVNIVQNILNQFGILWSGRADYPKALDYMSRAETLYHRYKDEVGDAPIGLEEYISKPPQTEEHMAQKRLAVFENTFTHTMYYLAQIFAHLGESKKSASYCHLTLQRQLSYNQYDPVEWAINAATLSQYYITVENMHMARHCLASSSLIFEQAYSRAQAEELPEDKMEALEQKKADISRCWAKYGLALLELSRDALMKEVEDMDAPSTASHNDDKKVPAGDGAASEGVEEGESSKGAEAVEEEKCPEHFDLELTAFEEKITDKFVKDFKDARNVFLTVQNWLNDAQKYFIIDEHCTDHIEITQDLSKAFKLLAFFEPDIDRQCRMHKRRVDLLLAELRQLNPQHYLLVCRQLTFELAETYSSMLDLKMAKLEVEGQTPTSHAVQKINSLARQSIEQFEAFLDSLKGGKPDMPEEFAEMDVRPALVAMMCLGRLYSKMVEPDVDKRVANLQRSLHFYKMLVDYCERRPEYKEKVREEFAVCQEMVQLMPLKLHRLQQEAANR